MQGVITDIHRTSTVDGPGIRTTVFTKGCPLRCIWCHNPEAQSMRIEKGYGRLVTVEEVVKECRKDIVYYNSSGGGVTISGGEPMAQAKFTFALLRRLQDENIHTTLDTTGHGPSKLYEQSLSITDLYLFDYKATDDSLHRKLTGVSIVPILESLAMLISNGAAVILRCPVVPGVNDHLEHLQAISHFEQRYPQLQSIEILTWHTMGNKKYQNLGIPVSEQLPKENVTSEKKQYYQSLFTQWGNKKVMVL